MFIAHPIAPNGKNNSKDIKFSLKHTCNWSPDTCQKWPCSTVLSLSVIFLPQENIQLPLGVTCPWTYKVISSSSSCQEQLRDTHPVLIEMISINGFFLIFGKSSLAPPNRFPLSFFWPRSLTEWPSNQAQDTHQHCHKNPPAFTVFDKYVQDCIWFFFLTRDQGENSS